MFQVQLNNVVGFLHQTSIFPAGFVIKLSNVLVSIQRNAVLCSSVEVQQTLFCKTLVLWLHFNLILIKFVFRLIVIIQMFVLWTLLYLSGHNTNIQQRPVESKHSERMFHQHLRTMLVGLWLWFPLNLQKKTHTDIQWHSNTEIRCSIILRPDGTVCHLKSNTTICNFIFIFLR